MPVVEVGGSWIESPEGLLGERGEASAEQSVQGLSLGRRAHEYRLDRG